jgi:hypothetical protein
MITMAAFFFLSSSCRRINQVHTCYARHSRLLLSSPNGVPKAAFVGATGSPKRVCAHLQELHPFLYHYPSNIDTNSLVGFAESANPPLNILPHKYSHILARTPIFYHIDHYYTPFILLEFQSFSRITQFFRWLGN